ncbi:hypothetical protein N481_13455 [Pseudoalteromonas luteoviolacea S4047-1]|uniref:Uncharacterized protein n=1 Tax=Pseudoalteromonas luteoviolacea S4054 TaxID=1129367 RepID=A0A0F6AH41_9GAMM|nr:hypothetical protein N479_04375 [Pseudoalteromonas luteoviolacea S4054]KZN73054.1 hypothetical protein N481_13455 [Pseudoalteromonas luteoviolacea S4047-1]
MPQFTYGVNTIKLNENYLQISIDTESNVIDNQSQQSK